jgi:hypothetical protein
MLLVPRQLLRSGMTGNVPYYGGRFSLAQAYAASHPSAPQPTQPPTGRAAPAATPPVPPTRAEAPTTGDSDPQTALRHLRESGVLTADEYDELLTRIKR